MKVVLGTLKGKGEELATFLEPRVGAKPELSGDTIEIDDKSVRQGVKPRHVKTYIKRFLYVNGVRKNYRVFVTGKELMVQEIELGEEEEEEKKKALQKKEEPQAEEKGEEKPEGQEEGKEEEQKEPEAPKPEAEESAKEEPEVKKPRKAPARKPRTTKKKAAAEES